MKIHQAVAAAAIALIAFVAAPASAADFSFSFTGPSLPPAAEGSGTFTADPFGSDWIITGISGEVDGNAITGLYAPGGFAGNNNILYSNAPVFDFSGVSFYTASASFNLYEDNGSYVGSGYALCSACGGGNEESLSSFSITAVPEPVTLSLFGAGLAGAAALRRRKKKAA